MATTAVTTAVSTATANAVTTVTANSENIIRFPRLNLQFDVDSVAFTIGNRDIAWYGVIITIGMIIAMLFGFSQMKKYGVNPDKGIDCVIAGIFGGIIGARLYYVIFSDHSYKTFKEIIDITQGGLAIYGGIIGALLFGCIMAKLRKVKIMPLLDVVGMSFLIGQCIGRWGNFCNHEAFGTLTDLPWGMTSERMVNWASSNTALTFPINSTAATFHPCFLYESLWNLLGFILIYFVFSKKRKFDGEVFLTYVAWYGTGRAFIEGLRLDSLPLGTLRVSQVLAIVSAIAAIVIILIMRQKVKALGSDYVLYGNSEDFTEEMKQYELSLAQQKDKSKKKKDEEECTVKIVEDDEDDLNNDKAVDDSESDDDTDSDDDVVSEDKE